MREAAMTGMMSLVDTQTRRLWRASRPLTTVGFGMLLVFGASLVGLATDARVITGAPAWLKPAKFAISSGVYALTLAWIMTYLQGWPRLTRLVAWSTTAVLMIEVALIDLQAARGVTSHFNTATAFDATVYAVMGVSILVLWGMAIALTVALFRQAFADPALGIAIRAGMLITVIGSGVGGLMTRPTDAQLENARATRSMPVAGAHTVGAADGGPGLPGTGWSREHGDLRVPHFLGLHAIQTIPAVVWLIGLGASPELRRRAALVVSLGYASLFAILLGQALGGQSVLMPGGATRTALVVWLVATALGMVFVRLARRDRLQTMPMMVAR
jgi:hypothetical protein